MFFLFFLCYFNFHLLITWIFYFITIFDKIILSYLINDTIIIIIININIFLFSLSLILWLLTILFLLLLLLIILYSSLLLSESVRDTTLFLSVITVFTLLFDIGQYLEINKKFFHKEFQYPWNISTPSQ